jgi:hypothetical protein
MIVDMSLVHVLDLQVLMWHVHVRFRRVGVLVLVGDREVLPFVTLARLPVMNNMGVTVVMSHGLVSVRGKVVRPAPIRPGFDVDPLLDLVVWHRWITS